MWRVSMKASENQNLSKSWVTGVTFARNSLLFHALLTIFVISLANFKGISLVPVFKDMDIMQIPSVQTYLKPLQVSFLSGTDLYLSKIHLISI
jgi:hypothetical protein